MLSLITAFVALQLQCAQLEATEPQVITEYVTEYVEVPYYVTEYVEVDATHECEVCGGHVTEWWTLYNDDMTDTFECCAICAEAILYEPWGNGGNA